MDGWEMSGAGKKNQRAVWNWVEGWYGLSFGGS